MAIITADTRDITVNDSDYLNTTLQIMQKLGVSIRDTYDPNANYDDFYSNGGRYDGPRLFKIEWAVTVGTATASAKKRYEVPGRKSIAYDSYRIVIPERFKAMERQDPIVHECVHFLQHTTSAEEGSYIGGTNESGPAAYLRYVSQRVELEAHLVQIEYVSKHCETYFSSLLAPDEMAKVNEMLVTCVPGGIFAPTVQLVMYCKQRGLI